MKRKVLGIVAAFVLASLGTVLLAAYVQSAKNKATAAEDEAEVLVVKANIPRGGTASADNVKRVTMPARLVAPDTVEKLDDLKDLVAVVDLREGEQLLRSRFDKAAKVDAVTPPTDKLQVTIALDQERAMGGRLRAGDRVAVVTSFDPVDELPNMTSMILHKVLVTNVQTDTAPKLPKPTKGEDVKDAAGGLAKSATANQVEAPDVALPGKLLVTLALDAHSVERVVFAAEHGFVWLALDPKDAPEGGTRIVTILDYALEIIKNPVFTDPNAPWNKED